MVFVFTTHALKQAPSLVQSLTHTATSHASDALAQRDDPLAHSHLAAFAAALARAKRVAIVAGAGISVAAGIPDFRSADGLYNLVKARYPDAVVKGRDLFDASLFRDPVSTSLFYSFIAELKVLSDGAGITRTHRFIESLSVKGKLLRCYTQNIDGLEARLDLESMRPPTAQQSASIVRPVSDAMLTQQQSQPEMKPDSKPKQPTRQSSSSNPPPPVLIHLHGALDTLICTICKTTTPFSLEYQSTCSRGIPPACPACTTQATLRQIAGKRTLTQGVLRPNIILYGEHHASGETIGKAANIDAKKLAFSGSVMIVMGTSLKVDGVKALVKTLAKSVREGGGCVLLMNRTRLAKEWDAFFDYVLLGDVDEAVFLVDEAVKKVEAAIARKRVGGKNAKGASNVDLSSSSSALQVPSGGASQQMKLTELLKNVKEVGVSSASSEERVFIKKNEDSDKDGMGHMNSQTFGLNLGSNYPESQENSMQTGLRKSTRQSTLNHATYLQPNTGKSNPHATKNPLQRNACNTSNMPESSSTGEFMKFRPQQKFTGIETENAFLDHASMMMMMPASPSKGLDTLSIGSPVKCKGSNKEGGINRRRSNSECSERMLAPREVRSSSVVRKVGEGSPTKKTKSKTLEEVVGLKIAV
ncbi:DHS-like NAD/FAD-binding domain-containing protein [Chytriomyces cf. hyalinus JEL632]|nr:DHS-like NAD/FAD-binding domain-containing protein [Chytriomyces cf. hyalinus JEL632]